MLGVELIRNGGGILKAFRLDQNDLQLGRCIDIHDLIAVLLDLLLGVALRRSAALPAGDTYLTLTVELFGPYDSAAAFARDCYTLTALAKQCTVPPEKLHFTWDAISAAESSLNTGSLLYTEDYSLDLSGAVQLDWTVQQMEQQTETEYLLDAENIPDED